MVPAYATPTVPLIVTFGRLIVPPKLVIATGAVESSRANTIGVVVDDGFVEVVDAPPGTREVSATNFCRLFAAADEHTGKVVVLSAIDNLWKGTSSQAVQNLNLMFGRPEEEGIT